MSWLFGGRKGHDPNGAAVGRQPPVGGVPPGVGMQQELRHPVQDMGAGGYQPTASGYQPVPQPAPRVQHQAPQRPPQPHQTPNQQQQHQQQQQTPPQLSHLGTSPTFQRHMSNGASVRVGALKYPALDMIEVSVKAGARLLARLPLPLPPPLPLFAGSGFTVPQSTPFLILSHFFLLNRSSSRVKIVEMSPLTENSGCENSRPTRLRQNWAPTG